MENDLFRALVQGEPSGDDKRSVIVHRLSYALYMTPNHADIMELIGRVRRCDSLEIHPATEVVKKITQNFANKVETDQVGIEFYRTVEKGLFVAKIIHKEGDPIGVSYELIGANLLPDVLQDKVIDTNVSSA